MFCSEVWDVSAGTCVLRDSWSVFIGCGAVTPVFLDAYCGQMCTVCGFTANDTVTVPSDFTGPDVRSWRPLCDTLCCEPERFEPGGGTRIRICCTSGLQLIKYCSIPKITVTVF